MNSHWLYNNEIINEIPEGMFGFVYRITNLESGRKYIGRKYLTSTTKKPLAKLQKTLGKKRRTSVTKESNWREYTGSNKPLNEDIKKLGKDKFKFEILFFGETAAHVNYMEMYCQYKDHVILTDEYYNEAIGSNKYSNISKKIELLNELRKNL